tara:strand:- start:39 stop:410 length:372 start_codon:yes stop_codon:yes gene_type:complete
MIQEAATTRPSMVNLAELILGGVYDLFEGALGTSIAWWVGHLTLIGLIALVVWVMRNWSDVSYGFEINGMRIWSWLVISGLTVGQMILYSQSFGFPFTGSLITSLMVSSYLWWTWYTLEPQKA